MTSNHICSQVDLTKVPQALMIPYHSQAHCFFFFWFFLVFLLLLFLRRLDIGKIRDTEN